MDGNGQNKKCGRTICIDELIDSYVRYHIIENKDGQAIDAVIVDMNAETEKIIGKKRYEFIGKKISQLLPANAVSRWIETCNKARKSGKAAGYKSHTTYEGHIFDTKISIDYDNDVDIIYHDVSAIYSARERYTAAEGKYKAIVETSPDIITRFDREMRHIFANSPIERITGIKSKDFIGKTHRDMGFPESLCELFEDRISKVFSTGRKLRDTFCFAGLTFDWYLVPEFSSDHEVQAVLTISRDISDVIASEEALKKSEEKYRNLVDQSIDGITIIDDHGYLIEFNRGMEKITGLKRELAIGRPAVDLYLKIIPEEHKLKLVYDSLKHSAELFHSEDNTEENGRIFDGIIERPDGTRRNIQDLSYKFKLKEGSYTCCITRDITEIKKLEELKKAVWENEKRLEEAMELERLRTEFFANISHELRTPLNIIFSSIQLIDSIASEEKSNSDNCEIIMKCIKSSKQNCYRLLRLINNLIDVTKIDAGFYQLNPINCNIVSVVEDITMSIAEYIKFKNINFVFDTDMEERIISCDPEKIERIVLNLLSNAIKFSDNGGCISVKILNRKEYVVISVKDTGIGIPEDKVDYIFERFRQIDNSLTRMYEGSGIGLSLVKSLVEMHGGSIAVKSILGKGTKFDVKLPAKVNGTEIKNKLSVNNNMQDSYTEKINIEFSDI